MDCNKSPCPGDKILRKAYLKGCKFYKMGTLCTRPVQLQYKTNN